MLHLLRRAAKTWAFRILFGLLIVSFAVWGIGDLDLGGGGTRVATVGEEGVTVEDFATSLSREMQSVSRRTGQPMDAARAREMGLPEAVMSRMVRDAALSAEARRLGVSADDHAVRDAIVDSESFRDATGTFSQEQYRFVLDRLGFTVDRFEDDLRRSLARDAVSRAVTGGAQAAPGLAERLVERALERRGFQVLTLSLSDAPDPGQPTETQLEEWHAANQDLYQAPETREAVWIEISPAAVAETLDIPEEDLRAAYDAAQDRYSQPERRVVDRLAFADDAAAEAAMQAIRSGETTFETLVEERGLTASDVAEGDVTRDDLSADAAEAVFSAELGVAGPVPSALGPSIYNVRAILPARTTPFEEARPELRDRLARERARDLAVQRAEAAADLLAAGASLEAIAEETGLTLEQGAVTAQGELAQAHPALVEEIFAAEPGEERDMIETQDGGFALVRVEDVTDAAPRPLSEVRDQAAQDWANARRREALTAIAERARADLDAGERLANAPEDFPYEVQETGLLRRADPSDLLPEDIRDALFAAEPGAAAISAAQDGVILAQLAQVEAADLTSGEAAQLVARWREALDETVANDLYVYYAAAVQDRIGATFNPEAMERAINALR